MALSYELCCKLFDKILKILTTQKKNFSLLGNTILNVARL